MEGCGGEPDGLGVLVRPLRSRLLSVRLPLASVGVMFVLRRLQVSAPGADGMPDSGHTVGLAEQAGRETGPWPVPDVPVAESDLPGDSQALPDISHSRIGPSDSALRLVTKRNVVQTQLHRSSQEVAGSMLRLRGGSGPCPLTGATRATSARSIGEKPGEAPADQNPIAAACARGRQLAATPGFLPLPPYGGINMLTLPWFRGAYLVYFGSRRTRRKLPPEGLDCATPILRGGEASFQMLGIRMGARNVYAQLSCPDRFMLRHKMCRAWVPARLPPVLPGPAPVTVQSAAGTPGARRPG
jgi:hypothetical protein